MDRQEGEFYTVRGYSLLCQGNNFITPSMEDYIEMIYRLAKDNEGVRISVLSKALNVQPPSSSKMVQKLTNMGYSNYQKYGTVSLSEKGRELGEYLINRHEIIKQFLSLINVDDGLLEQIEKIEHNIKASTLRQIKLLITFMQSDQQVYEKYEQFLQKNQT